MQVFLVRCVLSEWCTILRGHVTTMAKARKYTRDHLVMLRNQVAKMIKKGIGIERSGQIDQSRFHT
ncbi:MAG: hypothetical protein BMS9Abin11_1690 [Gammaproteobacteria bacterium]|nr:MAG: hypothetical protein BMS9Abin11_1690 [Gammaproteobacteria bacterium]